MGVGIMGERGEEGGGNGRTRVGGQDADGAGGAVWHPRIEVNVVRCTGNATGAEGAPEARFRRRGNKRAKMRDGYPASSEDRRPRRGPRGIQGNETGGGMDSEIRGNETGDGSAVFPANPLTRILRLSATQQDTPRPVGWRSWWIELTRVRGPRPGNCERLVATTSFAESNAARRTNWESGFFGKGGNHSRHGTIPRVGGGSWWGHGSPHLVVRPIPSNRAVLAGPSVGSKCRGPRPTDRCAVAPASRITTRCARLNSRPKRGL